MKQIPAAFLILLLCGCTVQEPGPAPLAPAPGPAAALVAGEAVVLVSEDRADGFGVGDFGALSDELGIRAAERVFPEAGEFEARHRAAGLHRWYRVSYDRSVPATKAQEGLGGVLGIEAVEIPRRKARRSFFNDPYAYMQWHYRNDGSIADNFVRGADINVEPVWRDYTAGRSEVIVAVLDGGIDRSHEDLQGVVLPPASNGGSRNFVEGYDPADIPADGHGTHVGGTIGAVNGNGIGVSGIAGGKDGRGGVRLMSCVIFAGTDEESEGGSGTEDADALVWAADHGAVIANNSWGYVFDNPQDAERGARIFQEQPSATKSAIDYFIDYAGTDANGVQTGPMKGGLVLFASGNTGWPHDAPSEYDRVVAVGSFGPDGRMSLFSNYGPWVDILAPGGSDEEDGEKGYEWVLSCVPDDTPGYAPYAFMSGTSMACPHVAGVAALLVSYYGGPGFTNADLLDRLLSGARTGVIDQQGRPCGGGKLDAAGSFGYSPDPVDPDHPITFSTDYSGDYRFLSHEQQSIAWRIHGNERTQYPVSVESTCPAVSATCNLALAQLHIDALRADPGSYTATIHVGDVAHKEVSFTILENHAPLLRGPIDDQILNAASSSLLHLGLDVYFQDPDGEQLSYTVSLADEGIAGARLSGDNLTLSPEGYGLTTVTVTARDARRASCSTTFQLLARNTYQALDIFPNPATDYLCVRPDEIQSITATLYSRSGAQVLTQTGQAGPFLPMRLDMQALPAGTYTLWVDYGQNARSTTQIVKY